MKNITIAATLLFALILSSCSTLKNTDIAKRRYNKGYYIAVRDQKTKTEPVATHPVNKKTDNVVSTAAPEETVKAAPAQTEVIQPVSETAKTNVTSATNSKKSEPTVAATSEKKESVKKHSGLRNPVIKQKTWSASKSTGSAASDLDLIILIILAIIIPPVAVYLVEGASKMFVITLILCLLSFTGFIFVFGYLLWFVAMLLALLVVLK